MSPVIDTGQTSWQNKHETYIQPLRRVLQAVNDPPQAGGGWSFSGAPSTDGYLPWRPAHAP